MVVCLPTKTDGMLEKVVNEPDMCIGVLQRYHFKIFSFLCDFHSFRWLVCVASCICHTVDERSTQISIDFLQKLSQCIQLDVNTSFPQKHPRNSVTIKYDVNRLTNARFLVKPNQRRMTMNLTVHRFAISMDFTIRQYLLPSVRATEQFYAIPYNS